MNENLGIAIIYGIIFAAIGSLIGKRKNRPVGGFVLGLLLGPLGWLLVFLGPTAKDKNAKHCPYCRSVTELRVRKCVSCDNIMDWVDGEPQRKMTIKKTA